MSLPNIPMVNLGNLYLQDCQLSWVSTTKIQVAAGQARDYTNVNDIRFPVAVSASTLVSGAGGLDVGSIAASTLYAVYVIGDSNGNPQAPTSSMVFSLNFSAPVLPMGYDMSRRVGAVLTDGSSNFLPFLQDGDSLSRVMWYDAGISALSAGASSSFAAVSFASWVPSVAGIEVILNASITPAAAGDAAALRPTGSSSTGGYVIFNGSVMSVAQELQVLAPVSALASLDYKVAGTLSLLLAGYVDAL